MFVILLVVTRHAYKGLNEFGSNGQNLSKLVVVVMLCFNFDTLYMNKAVNNCLVNFTEII